VRYSGLLLVAALLAFVIAGAVVWIDLMTPVALDPGGVIVRVPEGAGFAASLQRLQAAGVLRWRVPLRLWATWSGRDRQIRSGDFRFAGPTTPLDVLATLLAPANALHRVTIPEGTTVRGIAEILADAGFGGADVFAVLAADPEFLLRHELPSSGLEGYLFPDTYSFAWSDEPEAILAAMIARFRNVAAGLEEQRRARGMSEHEMVTLAAIIEKETGVGSERALISAVFHNRLRLGMRLQSDPTAVYGRDEEIRVPRAADLDVDTPHNTYKRAGLPPGPICNPGRAALEAALAPAAVPYLYFVAGRGGEHDFSVTLEEHNRAVARLRQRQR